MTTVAMPLEETPEELRDERKKEWFDDSVDMTVVDLEEAAIESRFRETAVRIVVQRNDFLLPNLCIDRHAHGKRAHEVIVELDQRFHSAHCLGRVLGKISTRYEHSFAVANRRHGAAIPADITERLHRFLEARFDPCLVSRLVCCTSRSKRATACAQAFSHDNSLIAVGRLNSA